MQINKIRTSIIVFELDLFSEKEKSWSVTKRVGLVFHQVRLSWAGKERNLSKSSEVLLGKLSSLRRSFSLDTISDFYLKSLQSPHYGSQSGIDNFESFKRYGS